MSFPCVAGHDEHGMLDLHGSNPAVPGFWMSDIGITSSIIESVHINRAEPQVYVIGFFLDSGSPKFNIIFPVRDNSWID